VMANRPIDSHSAVPALTAAAIFVFTLASAFWLNVILRVR
jgi:hypothetical protein